MAAGQITADNKTEEFGALSVTSNSSITLSDDLTPGSLTFYSGSRTGGTLTIYGWSGYESGGLWYSDDDKIFLRSAGETSADFLANVTFSGVAGLSSTGAMLRDAGASGWELVPVPEPSEYALVAGLGLVALAAYRRRMFCRT